jgi:hypothetical protein
MITRLRNLLTRTCPHGTSVHYLCGGCIRWVSDNAAAAR